MDLFSRFSSEERTALTVQSRRRVFPTGGQVYAPLEAEGQVFFIERGAVQFYELSFAGRKVILQTLGPGSLFGDLCTHNPPCAWLTNFAEAKPKTVLRTLSTEAFLELINRFPSVALRVIEDITHQLREAESKVKHFSLSDASTRLVGELIRYAQRHGEETACCLKIQDRLTHQEIAEMAALARETTTTLLNQLRRRGVIEVGPDRRLTIHKARIPRTF